MSPISFLVAILMFHNFLGSAPQPWQVKRRAGKHIATDAMPADRFVRGTDCGSSEFDPLQIHLQTRVLEECRRPPAGVGSLGKCFLVFYRHKTLFSNASGHATAAKSTVEKWVSNVAEGVNARMSHCIILQCKKSNILGWNCNLSSP